MDEQEFRRRADTALEDLETRLSVASGGHAFDVDFNNGTLIVEFEESSAKYVVSPNMPVRQIWVSARMKSYKLDWNDQRGEFVLAESGQTLADLIAAAISDELRESVKL